MKKTRPRPTLDRRYELIPQMRTYEQMRVEWVPHLMNVYESNFRSGVCNTDEHGFRYTLKDSKELDYAAFTREPGPKGLLCGGSTAFGTGATEDGKTIASRLNRNSGITWFNFGCMGHNSTQELLRFLLFKPDVDQVVLLTGINNLMIHTYSQFFSEIYGAVFSQSMFEMLNRFSSNRDYLKYLLRRVKSRAAVAFRRFIPGQSVATDPDGLPDFESRYNQSLEILARDLDVWAMLKEQSGFSLRFVLQPILVWMSKTLSSEEEELLEIMDTVGWRRWGGQIRALTGSYPRYREDTRQLCEARSIPWSDCNELLPKDGWLFCDRTHLTDKGQEAAAEIILSLAGSPV